MNIGEKFNFKGFEWVVLDVDGDAVTAIMTKAYVTAPFDENNMNKWLTSTIRKRLYDELLPVLGKENLITHITDMVADNGDTRYGTMEDEIWLISCDEFRKYRKIIIENCDFDDDWWWTLTPWYITDVGIGNFVRLVNSDGIVSGSNAYISSGVAPACVFHLQSLMRPDRDATSEIAMLKNRITRLENRLRELEETYEE